MSKKSLLTTLSALGALSMSLVAVSACTVDADERPRGQRSPAAERAARGEGPVGSVQNAQIADPAGCNDLHGGNFCGDQNPFTECWCDDLCSTTYFDCCSDKGATCGGPTGSCNGACGGSSPAGCWCDTACHQFGDCCPDKVTACG